MNRTNPYLLVRGMFAKIATRKETLVAHGFRLPSAMDNRPLNFGEFQSMLDQVVFVSATPSGIQICRPKGCDR